jgi:hypothetical protein
MPQLQHVLDYPNYHDLGSHCGDSLDCWRVLFTH